MQFGDQLLFAFRLSALRSIKERLGKANLCFGRQLAGGVKHGACFVAHRFFPFLPCHSAGLSSTIESGGRVSVSECGRPCEPNGTASTSPKFPCPLPP